MEHPEISPRRSSSTWSPSAAADAPCHAASSQVEGSLDFAGSSQVDFISCGGGPRGVRSDP